MIELRSVGRNYERAAETIVALQDVSLSIDSGEFLAVYGPSGSGKSTLLNLIGCLDRPTSGQVLLNGVDTGTLRDTELSKLRNRMVGFVFQAFNLVPSLSVVENVEMPLVYAGVPHRRRRDLIARALERVDLTQRADHPAGLLSGGEQQRAAIARALVNEPELVLADEPTGSIDDASASQVLTTLRDLRDAGVTIVVVTHVASVAAAAQRTVRLVGGTLRDIDRAAWGGSSPRMQSVSPPAAAHPGAP